MVCSVVEQVIPESLPHVSVIFFLFMQSVTVFSMILVPQYPGEWKLPSVSCVDTNEKCIPSDCKTVIVQVIPSSVC